MDGAKFILLLLFLYTATYIREPLGAFTHCYLGSSETHTLKVTHTKLYKGVGV